MATLVNEEKEPGIYLAEFNTNDYQLASGIYLYRIQSGNPSSISGRDLLKQENDFNEVKNKSSKGL